jgi:hypothetical protein
MPINVQHDIAAGFYSVPYFSAQDQRLQQQRAAEEAERQKRQLALQQLVMQLAQQPAPVEDPYPGVPRHLIGQMNAGIPLQPQAAPQSLPSNRANAAATPAAPSFDPMEKYKIDMDARTKRAAIMAGSYGDQLQAQTSSANQWNNMMGGLLERQMMGGQQFDQQMLAGDQRLGQLQYDANAELRNRAFGDLPADILEGVQRGYLRYSPDQKTERNRLLQALSNARRDPTLNPQQRIQAEAILAEQMRDIDLNPERVPPDEWPKTMQEMFDEETSIVDLGGQQVRVQRGERNGMPTWSVLEPPKDESVKIEADRQAAVMKQQQDEAKMYRDAASDEAKLKVQENKNVIDIDKQFFQMELEIIQGLMEAEQSALLEPDKAIYESNKVGPDGKPGPFDDAGYRKAMTEYQSQRQAGMAKYQPMLDALRAKYDARRAAMTPPTQSIMPSIQPTTPGIDPMQGAAPTPPQQSGDGSQVIGPNSLGEYARKYPDGRIEILSGGAP